MTETDVCGSGLVIFIAANRFVAIVKKSSVSINAINQEVNQEDPYRACQTLAIGGKVRTVKIRTRSKKRKAPLICILLLAPW